MERIVFLERNTFRAGFRKPYFEHEWIDYGETNAAEAVERLPDATIAICNELPLRQPELSHLPKLKLIMMKRSGLLINTARGGLVNEIALVAALQTGLIAGAGFDVLSNEPPRQGNPLLDLKLPNFVLTPHVAWASGEAMQALADQLVDNIEAFVRGEPKNLVV